ncbi:BgTH12-03525 [Blumeria graminis f. sp. triticale]|uniref:Ubiquitin carboxyl-terminal hydrolase n=1 Tax=Blumeria graminis f. sp. triticale TaxID=1689686 RepID=A0A9W4DCN7_BLUGR|nr:BgTH12-03525 [Blumeria graminis f. sp. triticale]
MMNGRHLPAGQGMPIDNGRRRSYNQHQHQQQYPQQPIYPAYVQTYSPSYYHNSLPSLYQSSPAQYQTFIQSPPMQQYVTPQVLQQQVPYPRPYQAHPTSSPYQSSNRALQNHSNSPSLKITPPVKEDKSITTLVPNPDQGTPAIPFRAPLPWLSRPELGWPAKRSRKKRKPAQIITSEAVKLSINGQTPSVNVPRPMKSNQVTSEDTVTRPETPSTTHQASEENSTNPSTPSSLQPQAASTDKLLTIKPTKKSSFRSTIIVPALPKALPRDKFKDGSGSEEKGTDIKTEVATNIISVRTEIDLSQDFKSCSIEASPVSIVKRVASPRLWTGLFSSKAPLTSEISDEHKSPDISSHVEHTDSKNLAEYLKSFNANTNDPKTKFLEPRGLVNTGNMCYMNSILQGLVFCSPFFNFLDQVSKRTTFSFKSETPLLDAMILFIHEYSVIEPATSLDQSRIHSKQGQVDKYGEPFTPDFFYNVINQLPRFSSMRKCGHQQDAEEFLGFLLEGLHDDCVQVARNYSSGANKSESSPHNKTSPLSKKIEETHLHTSASENGWLEVGPKQKTAFTRSSGTTTTDSPITKIFGGYLRSELRVPGLKDSVTMEPYQPLQLDVGAYNVNNIVDALKGLTHPESLHGDFKSPKGCNVTATKQVFIDSLPQVLILHLKRFQYDNAGGTQKIWKKVDYPLELELPKELFPRHKRSFYEKNGLPNYRLISVVYHHGKNASGGHYTVDVRRQDGREWIRLDDTVIKRVKGEEVVSGGSEEDLEILTTTLNSQILDKSTPAREVSAKTYSEKNTESGWKQANGPGKKLTNNFNGNSISKAINNKFAIKDNKVAYILFYQRIEVGS